MNLGRVLIVEDEASFRSTLRAYLEWRGLHVMEAHNCTEALRVFAEAPPDAVVCDFQLPDGDALTLLPRLRRLGADTPVVVITGHGTIDLAVQLMQQGAEHFLTKPVEPEVLFGVLERLIETRRAHRHQRASQVRQAREAPDPFLGASQAIQRLETEARRALETDSQVLLTGETGSGKGVLASWLHANGPRAREAFVDLNCAGISRELLDSELFGHEKGAFTGAVASRPGLLEISDRGTLFLDEIGDMDPIVQGKLLKVLEEKRFRRVGDTRDRVTDVRLIAATHRDLPTMVREKTFREDFYYRVSVIPLHVPSLRERSEDITPIARRLLARIAGELGRPGATLTHEAERALATHRWPGNVRELRNALERALLRSRDGRISVADTQLGKAPAPMMAEESSLDLTLHELQRRHVERVLAAEDGHVGRAAVRLGIPRSTLYQKLRALGITVER